MKTTLRSLIQTPTPKQAEAIAKRTRDHFDLYPEFDQDSLTVVAGQAIPPCEKASGNGQARGVLVLETCQWDEELLRHVDGVARELLAGRVPELGFVV